MQAKYYLRIFEFLLKMQNKKCIFTIWKDIKYNRNVKLLNMVYNWINFVLNTFCFYSYFTLRSMFSWGCPSLVRNNTNWASLGSSTCLNLMLNFALSPPATFTSSFLIVICSGWDHLTVNVHSWSSLFA